jgi:C4-dicarboxylate-specific signal transduction histidine kinase
MTAKILLNPAKPHSAPGSHNRARQPERARQIEAEQVRFLYTQQWMEKAASYIRSLKLHTRDLKQGEERAFSVLPVIEDIGILLSHRLRLSQCTLTVSCTSSQPMLHGDPSKLGQVLTNLIVNATDAYKEASEEEGEIGIEVSEDGDILDGEAQAGG